MNRVYACFPGGKHKALTLSYDDGKTQDRRLVDIFNRNGIEAVVLGTGMTKVHTTEEILKIENLNNIAELAFQLLTAE